MSSSTNLFNCVSFNDLEGLRRELQNRNTRVEEGGARHLGFHYKTPLQLAVALRRVEMVKLLIEANANPNASYGYQLRTPLHEAMSRNQCDMVMMLIACNADVEARDINGATPLFLASKDGIKLLMRANANVEAVNNRGLTPLMEAVRRGREDEVEMLLKHHAAVDAKDDEGLTPLMYVGLMSTIPPLERRLVIAKKLVKNGADIFATSNDGETALTFAANNPHHDFENFLRLEIQRQNYTAFVMASHDRLGGGSHAANLHEETRRMIWEQIQF
jgi:ankyrin repeat protein